MSNLTQAIEYAKAGDKIKARQILTEVIKTEPNNETAWLWMSSVVEKKEQQIYCLQQALRINPNNQQAAQKLHTLTAFTAPVDSQTWSAPAEMNQVKANSAIASNYRAQSLPDISKWSNGFRGWGILNKLEDGKRNSPKLGVFIAESGIAENRIFGWTALFIFLAIASGILAKVAFENSIVMFGIALGFFTAALYRLITWYLSKDLSIEIFREGFALRKDGQEHNVYWRDIEYVKERWEKTVYQGIIHIYVHKVDIYRTDGTKLELNRSLQKIEEIGKYIQLAVADALLPAHIERLKNNMDCDFGVFTLNQSGIKYKNKFLPWNMVKSMDVGRIGRTTVTVQAVEGSRWIAWAQENGGSVKNLNLFLNLSAWFINAARQSAPNTPDESDNGDVHYTLSLTKGEAQSGAQQAFYVGTPLQERELVVKVPPGTPSGTLYRFPDYGRANTGSGTSGTLTIEIAVEKITSSQKRWQDAQILSGIILLMVGMMWLALWSSLDIITSIGLAIVIGGIGGYLIAVRQRLLGVIAGTVGGAISFILQFAYIILMYAMFGRESLWNYEIAIVLIVSTLPGVGIYKLLQKLTANRQTQS